MLQERGVNPSKNLALIKIRLIGLFVAFSLSVTYYYLVMPWAMGVPGNSTNLWVFSAMSKSNYHMETLGVWRPRVAGLFVAGRMFDGIVKQGEINVQDYQSQKIILLGVQSQDNQKVVGKYFYLEDYRHIYGLYHACGMFAFLLVVLLLADSSVFIVLACFAGVLYAFTPGDGTYFYPWDMPSVTLFTATCLLWQKNHYNIMLVVIVLGHLVKETVAVTAILFLFTEMKLVKRISYLVIAAVATVLLKLALMRIMYGAWTLVTQDIVVSTHESRLLLNIKRLFTPEWNHFIFVNGGTLVIALLLPARTRIEWGRKTVILIFCAGQLVSGAMAEFRIWMEALPLSLICIRDYLSRLQSVQPPPEMPGLTPPGTKGSAGKSKPGTSPRNSPQC
jgi:hypothetical protein